MRPKHHFLVAHTTIPNIAITAKNPPRLEEPSCPNPLTPEETRYGVGTYGPGLKPEGTPDPGTPHCCIEAAAGGGFKSTSP